MRAPILLMVVFVAAAGDAAPRGESGAQVRSATASFDLASARIVDLTHDFDETTLYWPGSPSTFALEVLHHGQTEAGFYYESNRFCAPEHGGTHLDAPSHFAEGRKTAEAVPLEQLIRPAVVVDVSAAAAADPDYRLTVKDVRAWEEKHGAIPEGAVVLLRTGWGRRWPDRRAYFGDDTKGDASKLHFPSYGLEAATLLVKERRVAALGVDTASIDYGQSKDFAVHRVTAEADVPGLENLAELEQLPERGAWIVALPMKIKGGSGGPLRAVALLPAISRPR
jgi:kynurenine formamidase